jgi:hypothetical protein
MNPLLAMENVIEEMEDSNFSIGKCKGEHALIAEYVGYVGECERDSYYIFQEEILNLEEVVFYNYPGCLKLEQLDNNGYKYKISLKK